MCKWNLVIGIALVVFGFGEARSDIVGYWTFDSIQVSTIFDLSGNGFDARLGRPVNRTDDPVPTDNTPSGKPGDRAIRFNGSGAIVVDDHDGRVLDLSSGQPITMEVWLYPEEEVTFWTGLVQYGQLGEGYKIGIRYEKEFVFTLLGSVDISTRSILIEPDGQWHHLAAVWEPGIGVTFYHNGEETDYIEQSRGMIVPIIKELWIGSEYGPSNGFACTLDRVRISEGAVAPNDLDSDPSNPKPPTDNTRFYMTFDELTPPYTSATDPKLIGVTSGEWLTTHKVPEIVSNSPSERARDMAAEFSGTGTGELAHVLDPEGKLSFVDHSFTVEVWLKYSSLEYVSNNVLYYGEPDSGFALQINHPSGRLIWDLKGNRRITSRSSIIPSDGLWHHAAVANDFENSLIRFFVDGELTDEINYEINITPPETTNTLFIGAQDDSLFGFTGTIDRIRISDKALTEEELDSVAAETAVEYWMLHSE